MADAHYEVAFVGEVRELRTRHAIGLPDGPQELMRLPQILVVEAQPDEAMLFRYTAGGADCGDTWHLTVDDAKEQAAWEYEGVLGVWTAAPPTCSQLADALRYAQSLLNSVSRP
jgi:hypothetical protein